MFKDNRIRVVEARFGSVGSLVFLEIQFWKWYGVLVTILLAVVWLGGQGEKTTPVFYQQLAYKKFQYAEAGFEIQFPATVQTQSEVWDGKDISFNLRFFDPKYRYHGLIQRWKMKNIKEFVYSVQKHKRNIEDYRVEPFQTQNYRGYLVQYQQETDSGTLYRAFDLFIPVKDETVFRIVYFVPDDMMKEDHRKNFSHIVQSFEFTL